MYLQGCVSSYKRLIGRVRHKFFSTFISFCRVVIHNTVSHAYCARDVHILSAKLARLFGFMQVYCVKVHLLHTVTAHEFFSYSSADIMKYSKSFDNAGV